MTNLLSLAKAHGLSANILKHIQKLLEIDKKTHTLSTVQALLAWDQEIFMPNAGIKNRCEQMALLEKLIHEEEMNAHIPEHLHALEVTETNHLGSDKLPKEVRLWLRAKYRQWKIATSLPPALLQAIVKLQVESHHVWIEARQKNDYSLFAPYLERAIALQQDKADCLGYKESRYDALLDEFEIGLTTHKVKEIFNELQEKIVPLYQQAIEKSKSFHLSPLNIRTEDQQKFSLELMKFAGFHSDKTRLDISTHPFSTSIGYNDARITTRYCDDLPLSNIFSVLHEMGHGLYDLGIADIFRNTVCDEGASFGIHESQSRFLENIIGRSHEFWEYVYPKFQSCSGVLQHESLDNFMKRVLYINPGFIRVESDEIGYALHIIIRFEIEKELIEGNLLVNDIPELWNKKMESYLGIYPTNYQEGVLQDVHWADGLFGYFPSYQLGNLYSAELLKLLKEDHPNFATYLKEGNYSPILNWLREKVHKHGASLLPSEILPLSVDATVDYLSHRYL